nr:glutathione S-transferase family protein [Oceanococcus sp. HetDA_MAG_MS8]
MTGMKLYGAHRAINSDRVTLFLAEKGVDVVFVPVNIMAGEHYAPEYRKSIAPNARVPALQLEDGTVIRESVAICRYFEELHPETALFGRGALQKAQVEMWQRLMEFELMLPIAMAFRHGHAAAAAIQKPQIAEYAEACKQQAHKRLEVLNKELADREYLAGDFSIADITAYLSIGFGRLSKIRPADDASHTQSWLERVAARPGIAKGLAIIGGKA